MANDNPAAPKEQAEKEKAAEPVFPEKVSIDQKLDSIVVPKVDWEGTTLEEANVFLRMRAMELDRNEPKPHRKGFNIVIQSPAAGADPVRLTLVKEQTTLRALILEASQEAGMKFRVDDFALVLYPADQAADQEKPWKIPTGEAADFAAKRIIPRIDFGSTTLKDAVEFLNLRIGELTKHSVADPIVFDGDADPTAEIRGLHLRDVPLSHVLRYCTEAAGHRWIADDDSKLRIIRK